MVINKIIEEEVGLSGCKRKLHFKVSSVNRKVRIMFKNDIDGDVYSFVESNIGEKVLYVERYEIFVACVDILNFFIEKEGILCSAFVGNMGA